jgi:hypothetical protein
MDDSLDSLKSISKKSYQKILPESILNKPKTGWTAPINLWRSQFKKDCKEINRVANKITNSNNLPNDKRWAPILHLLTWQKVYNMNFII